MHLRRLEVGPIRQAVAVVEPPALELLLVERATVSHLADLERVAVASDDDRAGGAVVVRLLDRPALPAAAAGLGDNSLGDQ